MSQATLYRINECWSSIGSDPFSGLYFFGNINNNNNNNNTKNNEKLSYPLTLQLDNDTWNNANYLRRIARIHTKVHYPTLIDRANSILDKWEDVLQVRDRNLARMWMYPPHMIGQRLLLSFYLGFFSHPCTETFLLLSIIQQLKLH